MQTYSQEKQESDIIYIMSNSNNTKTDQYSSVAAKLMVQSR
jgi:hypothetical protein